MLTALLNIKSLKLTVTVMKAKNRTMFVLISTALIVLFLPIMSLYYHLLEASMPVTANFTVILSAYWGLLSDPHYKLYIFILFLIFLLVESLEVTLFAGIIVIYAIGFGIEFIEPGYGSGIGLSVATALLIALFTRCIGIGVKNLLGKLAIGF